MRVLKVGVLTETRVGEKRVALSPDVVKSLAKGGWECVVQSGAGEGSYFSDTQYAQAGADLLQTVEAVAEASDVILKVNPPTVVELGQMKKGTVVLSFFYAHTQPELVKACEKAGISVFAMDAVPRISRAQKMDALSSQANLAGYKAVLLGANTLGKIFPLMMTAAGTITPAKVLIFGAGVAGLQAIATAKRLGAVVEATDVRPETKEQVESLGGRFLMVEGAESVKTEGGYAREVSADYLRRQQEMIRKHVAEADLVITTALVMGKKAPILVTREMVESMRPGSVIVDMAVESGGNCELSEMNQTVQKHGVSIIGESNLPALLPTNASELYARNISALLLHLANKDGFKWEMEEEITQGCLIVKEGVLVHRFTKSQITQE